LVETGYASSRDANLSTTSTTYTTMVYLNYSTPKYIGFTEYAYVYAKSSVAGDETSFVWFYYGGTREGIGSTTSSAWSTFGSVSHLLSATVAITDWQVQWKVSAGTGYCDRYRCCIRRW